jgi:hypothetical protein
VNGTVPTPAGTGGVTDVAAYAARVRAHLVGMDPDQVDDLTDGLEADLADALADAPAGDDDLVARFGDPADYARELRVAAGLPEPEPGPQRRRGPVEAARATAGRARARVLAWLGAQAWWPPVRDLLVSCRSIWWLARAWVVYQMVAAVSGGGTGWIPTDGGRLVLLLVLVVISIQWGRKRWLPRPIGWLPGLVSVVAVIFAFPTVLYAHYDAIRWRTEYIYGDSPTAYATPQDGVYVDGMQVSNLFVYDADGNPLQDVQIYDDRGRAVRTTGGDGWQSWELPGVPDLWNFVPATDEDGRRRWNVYPLRGAPTEDFDWDITDPDQLSPVLKDGAEAKLPPRPFAKAPSLVELPSDAEQEPATSEDEGPSPEATPESDPAATPTP